MAENDKAEHTPGLMEVVHSFHVTAKDGRHVANTGGYESNIDPVNVLKENKGNALRLTAAWNACTGIPTSALEAGAVRELVEVAKKSVGTLPHAPWCGAQHADTNCKCAVGQLTRVMIRIEGRE